MRGCVPSIPWCLLQFHVVLATWRRQGLFAEEEAKAIAQGWLACQREAGFALVKVSFLPDHVHLALRTHPATSPAHTVVVLMNRAQEIISEHYPAAAVSAGLGRLWEPSAYIGGYGDLASPQIRQYLQKWQ
jgi:REP element-mobilizing transposase RayT